MTVWDQDDRMEASRGVFSSIYGGNQALAKNQLVAATVNNHFGVSPVALEHYQVL